MKTLTFGLNQQQTRHRPAAFLASLAALAGAVSFLCAQPSFAADYQQVLGPREWSFPRDHGRHDGFRMEWWYFTGNVTGAKGRRFGYELTFFRSMRPAEGGPEGGASGPPEVYFAHAAVSDVQNKGFRFDSLAAPGFPGSAGAADQTLAVEVKGWSCKRDEAGLLHLHVEAKDFAFELTAPESGKVLQGPGGFSRKSPEAGCASYYYSMPRLETKGMLTLGKETFAVTGLSWFDHEFFSHMLSNSQIGWDWVSLQLLDGRSLMLYRIRDRDGTDLRFGSLDDHGQTRFLNANEIAMTPSDPQQAPSGANYPQHWDIHVTGLPAFAIQTAFAGQEMRTPQSMNATYFEGVMDANADGKPVGHGYLEMTGYAGH
jgi:predicted secreted hydrolase